MSEEIEGQMSLTDFLGQGEMKEPKKRGRTSANASAPGEEPLCDLTPEPDTRVFDAPDLEFHGGDHVAPVYDETKEYIVLKVQDGVLLAEDPKTRDTHELACADLKVVHHYGLIFDMDGTLWDASESVAASWTEVLSKHPEVERSQVTSEEMTGVMGLTMTEIRKKLRIPEKVMQECMLYENRYLEKHGGKIYPEMKETLESLSQMLPLYIVSNCQSGYIEAFLKYTGFGKYFRDHLCFGDDNKGKDQNIRILAERNQLTDYYYVGDIENDYRATKAAGGTFIHAGYGFGEVPEAEYRIHKFADLVPVVGMILADRKS